MSLVFEVAGETSGVEGRRAMEAGLVTHVVLPSQTQVTGAAEVSRLDGYSVTCEIKC